MMVLMMMMMIMETELMRPLRRKLWRCPACACAGCGAGPGPGKVNIQYCSNIFKYRKYFWINND